MRRTFYFGTMKNDNIFAVVGLMNFKKKTATSWSKKKIKKKFPSTFCGFVDGYSKKMRIKNFWFF